MADTRADVAISEGVWVDLYSGSGITVGTAVNVYNKGSSPCRLAIKATAPSSTSVGVPLYVGATGSFAYISAGESGLWAYCPQIGTVLLIQE